MSFLNCIFSKEPPPPFSCQLRISGIDNPTITDIFTQLKYLFYQGLHKISSQKNKDSLDVSLITLEHIDRMKQYMLGFGIQLYYHKYSPDGKDYLYRQFLLELLEVKKIKPKVTLDWNSNLIEKIDIQFPEDNGDYYLKQVQVILKKHYKVNHFLKLILPKELRDHVIVIKKNNENITHYIYFDYARL